jgi:hypothetical protein
MYAYIFFIGDKSGMRKESGSVYDEWNISVVICNTDIRENTDCM